MVLTAVGRAASAEKRSLAMGLASAGGSLGQVLLLPMAQLDHRRLRAWPRRCSRWRRCMLAAAPLGILLDRRDSAPRRCPSRPRRRCRPSLAQACRHRGYRLLTIGFFTCGFQLAFIATHLPGYLLLCHMPIGLGATALALIGLFNMAGSWACGWLGGRFRQQHVLGWLYLIRGVAIARVLPAAEDRDLGRGLRRGHGADLARHRAADQRARGARSFGTRHLGTLFGVCFLSHQIGSFLGAWLGGIVFDVTGSYSLVWGATAVAGLVAALLHFLINDRIVTIPARPEPVRA